MLSAKIITNNHKAIGGDMASSINHQEEFQ